jgi:hypothetical protein
MKKAKLAKSAPLTSTPGPLLLEEVTSFVTFELNVRLDLSGKATTKSLSSLGTELVL